MTLASAPLFTLNGVYTFETLAPSILTAKLERVRCEGEVSYQNLINQGRNVGDTYRDVYRSLPQGTPDIPKLLRWYQFTSQTGSLVDICEQWVNTSTIELIERINIFVTIPDSTAGDVVKLTQLLRGGGFSKAEITAKSI